MKKRIVQSFFYVLCMVVMISCKREDVSEKRKQAEFQRLFFEGIESTILVEEESRNVIANENNELNENKQDGVFAVSDTGDIFISESREKVCRYSKNGVLLHTYEDVRDADALCLLGDNLFIYTSQDELLRLSIETNEIVTIVEQLFISEMQNLVESEGKLYGIVMANESGQYDLVVKQIDPINGSVKNIETVEGGIRAIYGSSDDVLYYCISRNGSTYLYSYQSEKEESKLVYDITNYLEAEQQVMSFVYERGLFVYTTLKEEIVVINLEEEKCASVPINGFVTSGKGLTCVKGNVICQPFSQESKESSLQTLYLEDIVLEERKAPLSGTITVRCSDILNGSLDSDAIEKRSGFRTEFITGPTYTDEFLAEVMAGNPDIDVYVFSMNQGVAQSIKEKGVFVPLNSSKAIKEYQEACFSYIADGMETETGDIWMLPIAVSSNCIWYVEDNLEKFKVSTEEFQTMESFFALSKEMKVQLAGTDYRAYVDTSLNLMNDWEAEYESVYCDFANGTVNYNTKEYRDFFERAWNGWRIYSSSPQHPYMSGSLLDEYTGMYGTHPKFNSDVMIYKWTTSNEQLINGNLEGWRVLPTPKFSEEVQENMVTVMGLVLNPYSEQKELAMAYLEEIAKNPIGVYSKYSSFLFEGINTYSEEYDITLPAVQDLYQLFSNGMIGGMLYPNYNSVVADYQEGRLSLDEAINALQRETEMWLNE